MTPIERAARALCALNRMDPDATIASGGFQRSVGDMPPAPRKQWEEFAPQVRAVIAAIREPSEEVVEAGAEAWTPGVAGDGIRTSWNAMIDALLAEGQ